MRHLRCNKSQEHAEVCHSSPAGSFSILAHRQPRATQTRASRSPEQWTTPISRVPAPPFLSPSTQPKLAAAASRTYPRRRAPPRPSLLRAVRVAPAH
eukprot:5790395-Pleurochrysis_carterae.AAC.1